MTGNVVSVAEIEHELARLRTRGDGPSGARSSVLNLIVVTSEESAAEAARVISDLSGDHPSRAILMVSDPNEDEANLEVSCSTFCGIGGRGEDQVCAEQITVHVEGPPAEHLESLAGPLLIPDLPVFLWCPNGELPDSSSGMVPLTDRLILDSGPAEDREAFLRAASGLCRDGLPAVGDLQWAALSPWRALVSDLFAHPERAGELPEIRHAEILYGPTGECQALLFAGWLASALDWRPESMSRTRGVREFALSGPSGRVVVALSYDRSEAELSRVRLRSAELAFEVRVSRRGERVDACATVTRGEEVLGERTVHLGSSGVGVWLGEELRLLAQDGAYEAALRRTVGMLDP